MHDFTFEFLCICGDYGDENMEKKKKIFLKILNILLHKNHKLLQM